MWWTDRERRVALCRRIPRGAARGGPSGTIPGKRRSAPRPRSNPQLHRSDERDFTQSGAPGRPRRPRMVPGNPGTRGRRQARRACNSSKPAGLGGRKRLCGKDLFGHEPRMSRQRLGDCRHRIPPHGARQLGGGRPENGGQEYGAGRRPSGHPEKSGLAFHAGGQTRPAPRMPVNWNAPGVVRPGLSDRADQTRQVSRGSWLRPRAERSCRVFRRDPLPSQGTKSRRLHWLFGRWAHSDLRYSTRSAFSASLSPRCRTES